MKRFIFILLTVLTVVFAAAVSAEELPPEPGEEPIVMSAEEAPAEPAGEEPAEVPAEPAEEVPAEEPAAEPAEEVPAEEPAAEPAEEVPAEEPAAEPAGEVPAEEPAAEPAEEAPVEELAAEPAEEVPAEAPAEESPAEIPGMATPTDLCPHENTKTVYYFDAPAYYPLDAESHLVTGQAIREDICEDCGTVLYTAVEENAQEAYPHVFRNNACVFCGWEFISPESIPVKHEVGVSIPAGGDNPNQYFYTLKGVDLKDAGAVFVLRPAGSKMTLVLVAEKLQKQMDVSGGTVVTEMEIPSDQAVNVFVRLYDADGNERQPGSDGVSLRIYGESGRESLSVVYTNNQGKKITKDALRINTGEGEGYWSVTWLGNGTYEY